MKRYIKYLSLICLLTSCSLQGMESKETTEHKVQATTSSSLTHDQDWSRYLQLIKGQIAASESNSSKKAAISNIVLKIAKQCKVDPETLLLSWDVATRTLFFAETLADTWGDLEDELAYCLCWITHMHSIPTTKENFLETTRITVQYLLSKSAYQAITVHLFWTLIMAATDQQGNSTYQEEYDCIVSTIFEAQCILEQNIVQKSENNNILIDFVLIGGLSGQPIPGKICHLSTPVTLPSYALKKAHEIINTEKRLSVLSPKDLWLSYVQYRQDKRMAPPEEPSLSRLRKDMVYRGLESYKIDPATVTVITDKYLIGPNTAGIFSGHCDSDYRVFWLDAGGDSPALRTLVLYAAYHEIGHLVDESTKKIKEACKAGKVQELVCSRQCELRVDLFAIEHLLHDEFYVSVIAQLATLIERSTKGLERCDECHPTFEEEYKNIINYLHNHGYYVSLSYLSDDSSLLNLMKKNQSKPLASISIGLKKTDIDTQKFDMVDIDKIKEQAESKASASSSSCTASTAQAITSSSAPSILATTSLQTCMQNAAIAPIIGEFKENEHTSKARLIASDLDKTIKILDPSTGECVKTLSGHEGPMMCLLQLTNGQLASCSYADDHIIKIWE